MYLREKRKKINVIMKKYDIFNYNNDECIIK